MERPRSETGAGVELEHGIAPTNAAWAAAIVGAGDCLTGDDLLDIPQTLGSLTFTSSSTTGGYTLTDSPAPTA